MTARDEHFMGEAIRLSRSHLGQTSSNPSVGCVIVKDDAIVGQAVTALSGRPHAETQALAEAGDRARGATAYVTLEPCSHHGKTPPCADALIAAGVARVVVAVTDPDSRVAGRGLSMLRQASIAVETGLLEKQAARVLSGYLTRQTKGRPQVILKLAVSADGMIGARGQGQIAITGAEARKQVQQLRAESDAILVGIGTALADDPSLTVRLPGLEHRSPIRIVLDRRLELPLDSALVRSAQTVPVIAVTDTPSHPRAPDLAAAGVEVLVSGGLPDLLAMLGARGLSSLIVEGGAKVATEFLAAGLVDAIHLYSSPLVIGGTGIASPVTAQQIPSGFQLCDTYVLGKDMCSIYERN